jgi:hypothetical protein
LPASDGARAACVGGIARGAGVSKWNIGSLDGVKASAQASRIAMTQGCGG